MHRISSVATRLALLCGTAVLPSYASGQAAPLASNPDRAQGTPAVSNAPVLFVAGPSFLASPSTFDSGPRKQWAPTLRISRLALPDFFPSATESFSSSGKASIARWSFRAPGQPPTPDVLAPAPEKQRESGFARTLRRFNELCGHAPGATSSPLRSMERHEEMHARTVHLRVRF